MIKLSFVKVNQNLEIIPSSCKVPCLFLKISKFAEAVT